MPKQVRSASDELTDVEARARRRLAEFFNANDRIFEDSQKPGRWSIGEDSSIAKDDEGASPFLMSSHVLSQLQTAAEHIDAASRLLRGDSGVMHVHADFTLIRSAIECAAMAHWALMPGDRLERVRRVLRIAFKDASDSAKILPEAAKRDLMDRRRERITDVAKREGLTPSESMAGYTTTSVLSDVGSRLGSDVLFTWQLCSGMAHGKQWSLLALSEKSELATKGDVVTLKLTARTEHLMVACFAYVEIMQQLLPVFHGRRGGVPHTQPPFHF